jgi:hypothetical protein
MGNDKPTLIPPEDGGDSCADGLCRADVEAEADPSPPDDPAPGAVTERRQAGTNKIVAA